MKRILVVAIAILITAIILFVLYGFWRTRKSQKSIRQKTFLNGTMPNPELNGFYRGLVTGYKGAWQGKKFNPKDSSGINIFRGDHKDVERYPFKTYISPGVRDRSINVLKIDYSIAGNPWWVRLLLDEVVEVSPGRYLGKVHVRLVPGQPFSIGYFQLERSHPDLTSAQ